MYQKKVAKLYGLPALAPWHNKNWFANYQDFGLQNLMLSDCKGIDGFFPAGSEYSPCVCAKSEAGVP